MGVSSAQFRRCRFAAAWFANGFCQTACGMIPNPGLCRIVSYLHGRDRVARGLAAAGCAVRCGIIGPLRSLVEGSSGTPGVRQQDDSGLPLPLLNPPLPRTVLYERRRQYIAKAESDIPVE